MDSILTNSAALSALQSLNMVQQALQTTQNQVSSGLAVATAADNAAYWAIGQQLTSDSGIVTSANTALAQSQAILDTANSAISSVITTIDAIQSAVTEATNPGADLANINSTLASLSTQLTGAIGSAAFNGVNLLDGSQTNALSFVSGYDATANGGTVSTINFSAQALVGGTTAAVATSTTQTPQTVVTDTSLISQLESQAQNKTASATSTVSWDSSNTKATSVITVGASGVAGSTAADTAASGSSNVVSVVTTDPDGEQTTTTYTAYTSYNAAKGTGTAATNISAYSTNNLNGASVWTASSTIGTAGTASAGGLLVQNGTTLVGGTYDLTSLGSGANGTKVTASNANDMLSAVAAALSAVTTYAASIGSTQVAMTAASTFNSALNTDYANGISALVDADMNTASTRLQALQTQEQLGIQSLSIANQNSQLILKLFNG